MTIAKEKSFPVFWPNEPVRFYIADIVVNKLIIIELKTVERLHPMHRAQALNYLKASGPPVTRLFKFGSKTLETKRIIL
jgi:GxxExxY protein